MLREGDWNKIRLKGLEPDMKCLIDNFKTVDISLRTTVSPKKVLIGGSDVFLHSKKISLGHGGK